MEAGHTDAGDLCLPAFTALALSHFDAKIETEQRQFLNVRMAFHADAKAAKKWTKQWAKAKSKMDPSQEDIKRSKAMLLRSFQK